jgi:DHA2 family multidrug resistance protein-like MFS transporter
MRLAYVMSAGLVLSAIGFAMFAQIGAGTGFVWFATGSSLFSLGMSPVFTMTTDLIIGTAPPERAGAASAISETSAELGGALGIALFGSIGVAIYRMAMADRIPAALAADRAESARATLGGDAAAGTSPTRRGAHRRRSSRSSTPPPALRSVLLDRLRWRYSSR